MNTIFLLRRINEETGHYDEYDGFVMIAESAIAARGAVKRFVLDQNHSARRAE